MEMKAVTLIIFLFALSLQMEQITRMEMKAVTLIIFLFALSLQMSFGNDYKVVYERIVNEYTNREYLEYAELLNTYYNRSTKTFSAKFHLLKILTSAVKIRAQAYVFLNNEYKLYPPIRVEVKFCEALEKNIFTIGEILSVGNVTKCPIAKGYYYVNNFRGNESGYPPFIPFGKYRIQLTFIEGKTKLWAFSGYVSVINKLIK